MNATAEDFRRHYESLSDEALLEIDAGDLTQLARACHAAEVTRRGLDEVVSHEAATDAAESSIASGNTAEAPGELVCVVEYDYHDEADLARGMLEANEISASLESEPGVVRLMVPAAQADQALKVLASTPLSDEELAAQAEAAGFEEEEVDEEEILEEPEEEPRH